MFAVGYLVPELGHSGQMLVLGDGIRNREGRGRGHRDPLTAGDHVGGGAGGRHARQPPALGSGGGGDAGGHGCGGRAPVLGQGDGGGFAGGGRAVHAATRRGVG